MNKLIVLVLCLLVLNGCSNETVKMQKSEEFYLFSGTSAGIVDQSENDFSKKDGVKYTLTVINYNPAEISRFKEYNESSQTKERFVQLTDRTRVFKVTNNKKVLVPATDLDRNQKIQCWVNEMYSKSLLEAIEVNILE